MKRFVLQVLLFACLVAIVFVSPACIRLLKVGPKLNASLKLAPAQKILFIGDSHIGCTFVEEPKYANCVLWASSMPQQFTLMRLREMEKRGFLENVELLVLDIGLQNFGQQRKKRIKELWWRMLPISINHSDLLPLTLSDKIDQFMHNPRGKIQLRDKMPKANKSILSRTDEERARDFKKMTDTHFNWLGAEDEMCDDWEESLRGAITGIVEICKRNSIRLIFITAPLTTYYVKAIPEGANLKLKEYTDIIESMGVPYYDLREWSADDDFRDCFHLRLDGAIKFTDWFYQEIIPKHISQTALGDTREG